MTRYKLPILIAAGLVFAFLAGTFLIAGMQGQSSTAEAGLDAPAPQQSR